MRHAIVAYACEHPCADVGALALAVTEAVSNAVIHAYRHDASPGEVEVCAEQFGDRLHITVSDQGIGMTPRPDSPGLGLGLPLIATLAESVDITTNGDTGTRLAMTFPVLHAV